MVYQTAPAKVVASHSLLVTKLGENCANIRPSLVRSCLIGNRTGAFEASACVCSLVYHTPKIMNQTAALERAVASLRHPAHFLVDDCPVLKLVDQMPAPEKAVFSLGRPVSNSMDQSAASHTNPFWIYSGLKLWIPGIVEQMIACVEVIIHVGSVLCQGLWICPRELQFDLGSTLC